MNTLVVTDAGKKLRFTDEKKQFTNTDLIKEQIKIANGDELNYVQNDIQVTGHAIECRLAFR